MRTSSRASRKMTCGRIPRPSSAPRIAPNASGASPDRTSSTIATARTARDRGHELGELGQQLAGQVVDDGVAEVLEQLRRGRLAAAREAAEDRRRARRRFRSEPAPSSPHERVGAGSSRSGGAVSVRHGTSGDGAAGRPSVVVIGAVYAAPNRPRSDGSAARSPDRDRSSLEQDVHREAEDERADEVAARRHHRREDRDPEDDRIRRDVRSRCDVTIPTRDSPTAGSGTPSSSPKARNSVVTKSK
jgi:hypothetical protein